ncbi:MAG: membrane-bound PQQ-dependent dehydrogenase, glucose/quinate/shikimate family [Pseudomonadota bacterium]
MKDNATKRPWFLALVLTIIGVSLLVMGAILIGGGGTWYYGIAGLTLFVIAVFVFNNDGRGALIYGAFLAVTYVWALYEVGPDAWALMPRVAMFSVLGLWFLLPATRRKLGSSMQPLLSLPSTKIVGFAALALVAALFWASVPESAKLPSAAGTGTAPQNTDWAAYGATRDGTRYSPHAAIDRDNVAGLERAWVARTGVPGTFKGTPLQVADRLYLCSGQNVVLALDPDTGVELWRHDPEINTPKFGFWDTCRGVTYYASRSVPERDANSETALCSERIFTATTDARLIALDAATGARCPDFGQVGEISLLPGMGEVKPGFYYVTSPPTIASGAVVFGGWVVDNQEVEEPSGVVRGFDPLSGELLWAWDMGRDDTGLPPEGESYTRGTPNVWSLTSADDELGLVYVPTGNATPDYFGGHRSDAMEKYASSVVAIDATTGKARWHFQTTHHDIWDYDVPSQPTLVDVPVDGVVRKALIQATKRAEIFLLDRETGEPLASVEERTVPQTTAPQEWTSPTQPFSTGMPSFAHPRLTGADMWGLTPLDQLVCRIKFARLDYDGPLTPPSIRGALYYPGIAGGQNWGSVAVDVVNQLMVVNTLHMPFEVRLIPRDEADQMEQRQLGLGGQQAGTPYAVYSMPFLSPLFAPCLRPPYGEMAVVDLASREVLWRRPLGTARQQGPLGIPSGLPLPMGMFYSAGSIVTAGGLIFIGGVMDSTMRAIDLYTGEELWQDRLPTSAQATPMSYVSPATGAQYVLVTVPGGSRGPLQRETTELQEVAAADTAEAGGYVIAYRLADHRLAGDRLAD